MRGKVSPKGERIERQLSADILLSPSNKGGI